MLRFTSIVLLALLPSSDGFSLIQSSSRESRGTTNCPSAPPQANQQTFDEVNDSRKKRNRDFQSLALSGVLATSLLLSYPTQASEIGVEVEAPTLYTGESVMICKKRGPLGACLETVVRTDDNDNDKARKYFTDPSTLVKKELTGPDEAELSNEGSALIERLRRQTKENFEKNELEIQRKTFENDQSAITGPFSRQVLIMNTDGKTFTLLDNPQAMRMKDAGFIKDKKFVKQPTEEELEAYALAPEGGSILDGLQGIFGGGSS